MQHLMQGKKFFNTYSTNDENYLFFFNSDNFLQDAIMIIFAVLSYKNCFRN